MQEPRRTTLQKNQDLTHSCRFPSPAPSKKPRLVPAESVRDQFYWLGEFNKASTVMVVEQGIVNRQLGARIAKGVAKVIADGSKPGADRPADYLQLEHLLIEAAGPDITRMHSGRSRQDILATTCRVMLREQMLTLVERMIETRVRLGAIAALHVKTIIPAYTNGVQAQPTTLAHYLLAFDAAFGRDLERLRQAYARLNLSPMGAAALGTSSFPVDRLRLAELLGFDSVVENSYDANLVSAMDTSLELVNIVSGTALTIGAMVEDITAQYRSARPWMLLHAGELTGSSSIMPQKRNPYGLNLLRQAASTVIGECHLFTIHAHNLSPGMLDYKIIESGSTYRAPGQASKVISAALEMLRRFGTVLDNLSIHPERALEEVDADYSTTTELADVLQRDFDVPFRIGHHFASELVSFGRLHAFKPADLPYSEVRRIYLESNRACGIEVGEFPMTERQFRKSLCARNMVNSSLGLGGPQPPEVRRMLGAQRKHIAQDQKWLSKRRDTLRAAEAKLDKAFEAIRR